MTARDPGHGTRWYLAFLVVLAVQPYADPASTAFDWWLALAVAIVAAALYELAEAGVVPTTGAVVAFAVLGTVAHPLNSGASVMLVYAASYAGLVDDRAVTRGWLAALSVLHGISVWRWSVPAPFELLVAVVPLVLVWAVGSLVRDKTEQEAMVVHLRADRASAERLATLTERDRIARDLHDVLGHTLTSVVVRAQLVGRLAGTRPEKAEAEAAQVERDARAALAQVRATVQGYRGRGLVDEVADAEGVLAAAGVEAATSCPDDLSLPPAVDAALALALREAVTNVVRHADADDCTITVTTEPEGVRVVVSDDGVGGAASDGSGLTGMRERLADVGGALTLSAAHGTTVTMDVPTSGQH